MKPLLLHSGWMAIGRLGVGLLGGLFGLGVLSGCDRYVEPIQCGQYFEAGDFSGWQMEANGTALDPNSGLRWYRCNAGERFANNQCMGDTLRLDLADARAYVTEVAAASGQPWRLPTLRELGTLTQTTCNNPAINPQIFPSVLVEQYWAGDTSPNGPRLGCTYYTYSGNAYCRASAEDRWPFWMVLDKP